MGVIDYFAELVRPSKSSKKIEEEKLAETIRQEIISSLKTVDGMELPDVGRSSKEPLETLFDQIVAYDNFYSVINPALPYEADILGFLGVLSAINPDVSQAIKNYENFANTGHQVEIQASSEGLVDAALERINTQASTLYQKSCGVDGLINHYIRQIVTYGALSSEDVVNNSFTGVEEIVIVPVESIRFKLIDGKFQPYQQVNPISTPTGLVELNPNTYSYFAWRTMQNSPYALPPFTSAVEAILMQHDMNSNIKFILRKLGLLGLVAITLKKPKQYPGESNAAYEERARNSLSTIANSIMNNYHKGMMIKYEEQEFQHFNVTADARGGSDLYTQNEQQVFSGLGTQPALHGRTYSTTETYAGVVYNMLVTDSLNIQRLPKRRMEKTYKLDLFLQGIMIDSISITFNKTQSLNPQADAATEKTQIETAKLKVDMGLISLDQAAQENGYEEAFKKEPPKPVTPPQFRNGEEQEEEEEEEQPQTAANVVRFKPFRNITRARFRFDRNRQQYRNATYDE